MAGGEAKGSGDACGEYGLILKGHLSKIIIIIM